MVARIEEAVKEVRKYLPYLRVDDFWINLDYIKSNTIYYEMHRSLDVMLYKFITPHAIIRIRVYLKDAKEPTHTEIDVDGLVECSCYCSQ